MFTNRHKHVLGNTNVSLHASRTLNDAAVANLVLRLDVAGRVIGHAVVEGVFRVILCVERERDRTSLVLSQFALCFAFRSLRYLYVGESHSHSNPHCRRRQRIRDGRPRSADQTWPVPGRTTLRTLWQTLF